MSPVLPPLVDVDGLVRAAVLQVNATEDVQANVAAALALVDRAADRGARLVVLPEKFTYLGRRPSDAVQPLTGPLLAPFAEAARRHRLYLVAGSVWEGEAGAKTAFNTSVFFGPDGSRLAEYRKIHMFDVEVGGQVYRESENCRAGDRVVAVELPSAFADGGPEAPGVEGPPDRVVLGMTICYDLRFPELYRALADMGAGIVTVPSGFTMQTGRDHWEVLLRARAIEDQVYVVAANQTGRHEPDHESYGRSMIVDPWGVLLAQVPDGPGLAVAELDMGRLRQIRRRLPSLANRDAGAYSNRELIPLAP